MPIAPTQEVRNRARTGGANGAANGGGRAGGWMAKGDAARQKQEQEQAAQQAAAERRANGLYMPFRFWVPVGEQREIVVLDAEPGPCFYEHQLQNPRNGKWDIHEACPKEWEPCPLCDTQKDSYYVMMLTVMDLTPYTKKNGEVVNHSRKLLAVKTQQQPFFLRQFDRHGTLRGLQLLMARDNRQTAGIGNPEFVALHSEEDIMSSFGHDQVVSQDGKVLKEANSDCFALQYEQLFTQPSAEDLRARYGGTAPAGSASDINNEWSNGGGNGGGYGGGYGGGATQRGNGGAAQQLDDEIPF